MTKYKEQILLSNENIDATVQACTAAYEKEAGKRAVAGPKLALAIEEILLQFKEAYGTQTPCLITLNKARGGLEFSFTQQAPQKNPIPNDMEDVGRSILARMGVAPRYYFDAKKNANVVVLPAALKPKKNKSIYQILTALALAIVCYFGISLLPEATQSFLVDSLIGPFFNKLTAVISAIATPLVFFAVVNGIADIGDVNSLGQIGKGFLSEVMGTYIFAGVVFSGLAIAGYGIATAGAEGGSGFLGEVIQLVLDIVPSNLVEPFAIDNDLQVVVIAIFLGAALIMMSKKSNAIKDAMATCGDLVNQMMSIALKLIPAIVFLGILNILCKKMQGLESLYIMLLIYIASALCVLLFVTIRACRMTKTPFKVFFKKTLPTTMINLTTSSQVSALPENMICCKEKFGIDEKLVDFGLPLGIVIDMPNGACFLGLTGWALAELAGIPMSLSSTVLLMIMSIIVAIAAPPIPGSAFTVLPILMAVCNIPSEFYPIAIIAGTFIGYFLPMFNGYTLQLQMVIVAKKLGMIDLEALHKE